MGADDLWKQMSDEDVIAASLHLDDYTESAQATIMAELSRRGLKPPVPDVADDLNATDDEAGEFQNRLPPVRLWLGGYPLRIAFWGWLVFAQIVWAAILRTTSGLFFLAFSLASIIYTGVALVGVWRSAKRYKGPEHWATLAQVVVMLIVVAFTAQLVMGFFRMPL